MRTVLGLLALHAALIGVGGAWLSAVGLLSFAPGGAAGSEASRRSRSAARGPALLSALGPALLVGMMLVIPTLIAALVLGIAVSLITVAIVCVGWALPGALLTRRRRPALRGLRAAPGGRLHLALRAGQLLAVLYAVGGAVALARSKTVLDDARIWSLRGLTLAYYHHLVPTIFLNQAQSGGHPVYPLFQPVLEAVFLQAAGHPALALFHMELWLVFGAGLWTAGYLLMRCGRPPLAARLVSLAPVITLAVITAVVIDIHVGDADTTGAMLLAIGALGLGLWLETDETGCLGLAALGLGAAASTKDEDLIGALCVLVIGLLVALVRSRERRRLIGLAGLVGWCALAVGPWRIWVAAHHLSEAAQPALPGALEPSFLATRGHEFTRTATAMLHQVNVGWDWLAAVFLVTAVLSLRSRETRPVAALYLGSVILSVLALLWLYTTTSVSLAFLLPTSMGRTISVFMFPALIGTGQLLRALAGERSDRDRQTRVTVDREALPALGGAGDPESR